MNTKISAKTKLIIGFTPIAFVLLVILSVGSPKNIASIGEAKMSQASRYSQSCAKCHGADGTAQTAKGKKTHATDLTKSRVSDSKGIRIISNGSGEMPDYKGEMSSDEIKAMMAYVKGFRK